MPRIAKKWKQCYFYKGGFCSIMLETDSSRKRCNPINECVLGLEISRCISSTLHISEEPEPHEYLLRAMGVGPLTNYF